MNQLKTCVVCGDKNAVRAHPEHDVCTACTDDPQVVRQRLEQIVTNFVSAHQASVRRYEAAKAALSPDDAARWGAFGEAWIVVDAGVATPEQERKVSNMLAALKAPAHPRITDGLRAIYVAWEAEWWARHAVENRRNTCDVALAQLGVCLEDLERQGDADALYVDAATR